MAVAWKKDFFSFRNSSSEILEQSSIFFIFLMTMLEMNKLGWFAKSLCPFQQVVLFIILSYFLLSFLSSPSSRAGSWWHCSFSVCEKHVQWRHSLLCQFCSGHSIVFNNPLLRWKTATEFINESMLYIMLM